MWAGVVRKDWEVGCELCLEAEMGWDVTTVLLEKGQRKQRLWGRNAQGERSNKHTSEHMILWRETVGTTWEMQIGGLCRRILNAGLRSWTVLQAPQNLTLRNLGRWSPSEMVLSAVPTCTFAGCSTPSGHRDRSCPYVNYSYDWQNLWWPHLHI